MDAFQADARDWLTTATHPTTGLPYAAMTYQPMLELLVYLRDRGFATYIVSGGGAYFMRAVAQDAYGIPPWQVIGTEGTTAYTIVDGTLKLTKQGGMTKPAHSMIRVLDEERSLDFYRRGLDLNETDRFVFDDFTLIFLTAAGSGFELEMTINHGVTKPYTHGSGYRHFAVSVDDLEHAHAYERCSTQRLNPAPIKELHSDGKLAVRFFFVTDPDGYKIEVVQRQGRYR